MSTCYLTRSKLKLAVRLLVPYYRNTTIKNQKPRNVYLNYVVGNTHKVLIPPCGVLVLVGKKSGPGGIILDPSRQDQYLIE